MIEYFSGAAIKKKPLAMKSQGAFHQARLSFRGRKSSAILALDLRARNP
jgi:hypothetical protein